MTWWNVLESPLLCMSAWFSSLEISRGLYLQQLLIKSGGTPFGCLVFWLFHPWLELFFIRVYHLKKGNKHWFLLKKSSWNLSLFKNSTILVLVTTTVAYMFFRLVPYVHLVSIYNYLTVPKWLYFVSIHANFWMKISRIRLEMHTSSSSDF